MKDYQSPEENQTSNSILPDDKFFNSESYWQQYGDVKDHYQVVRRIYDSENHEQVIIEEIPFKKTKDLPAFRSQLRSRIVEMPEEIYQASGIKIFGHRIKSMLFSTDVAVIRNSNAQSVMAVYPFTPQITIVNAIISSASVPVFAGVGGGLTTGERSIRLAFEVEQLGAFGVVVNSPMKVDVIRQMAKEIDIPIITTVTGPKDEYLEKLRAGAFMLNISAGAGTVDLVKEIRSKVGNSVPIIATGGPTGETIAKTIEAGANMITYTPPTSAEIFAEVMDKYRKKH